LRHSYNAVIATSIAPFDIEKQSRAVSSWSDIGFAVVSLNCKEEIAQLRHHFPQVTFIQTKRDARLEIGKPLIYFDDFLSYFRHIDIDICGIVNSDILLDVSNEFISFLSAETKNSMIAGCRVDVQDPQSRHGKIYVSGFDYFFFDSSIITCYPEERFVIGAPWWDYWAMIVPLMKGIAIKQLVPPIGYHVEHSFNWSSELWHKFAEAFGSYINKQNLALTMNESLAQTEGLHTALASAVLRHIHDYSEIVTFSPKESSPFLNQKQPHLLSLEDVKELSLNLSPINAELFQIVDTYVRKCLERCPSFLSASFTISNLYVELGFKDKADDNILFGEGFYFNEGTGRWINKKGHLIISKLALAKQYVISFELTCGRAEYYEHFPFDVQLNVNNAPPYRLTFNRGDQTQKVQLRIDKIDSDIHILIECDESFVPSQVGINNDNRQLSIRLSNLNINPIKLSETI